MFKVATSLSVIIISLIIAFYSGYFDEEKGAEIVVMNSRFYNGEKVVENSGFCVVDGVFVNVGESEEVLMGCVKSETVVLSDEVLITPGFCDSHVHAIEAGFMMSSVQLRDAMTKEEFVLRIEEYAGSLEEGEWIRGGQWNNHNWGGEEPTQFWINEISQVNPVWICRLDGHMCLANKLALDIAKITNEKIGEDGVVYADNQITGLLKDNAMNLINDIIPEHSEDQYDKALQLSTRFLHERGVTCIHEMPLLNTKLGWYDLNTFQRAVLAGTLKLRTHVAVAVSDWMIINDIIGMNKGFGIFGKRGRGDSWMSIGNLKAFTDGSLGSHTALMHEPYSDNGECCGLEIYTEEELYNFILDADTAHLQVSAHAIGDKAIDRILSIFERVIEENGPRDRRFRIEHAQHISHKNIHKFSELGVIASMQPTHLSDDGQWFRNVIGEERLRTSYPFRSLLDHNTTIIFGSDWFVELPEPIAGIHSAVTRRTWDGKNPDGLVPEEKITVLESLHAYTYLPHYATFKEEELGKIQNGYLADFVVLDKDLFTLEKTNPDDIKNTQILSTIINGEIVYQKQ